MKVIQIKLQESSIDNTSINIIRLEMGFPLLPNMEARLSAVDRALSEYISKIKAQFELAYTDWDADHQYVYLSYQNVKDLRYVLAELNELIARKVIVSCEKGTIDIAGNHFSQKKIVDRQGEIPTIEVKVIDDENVITLTPGWKEQATCVKE